MSNRITIQNDADVNTQAYAESGVLLRLNRLFRFDELVAHYGGPPAAWELLRALLPVACIVDGEAVYIESHVDGFLHTFFQQSEADKIFSGQPRTPSVDPHASTKQDACFPSGASPSELTTSESARYLSVSVDTLGRYVKSGLIARRNISPSGSGKPRYRFRISDLDRLRTESYRKLVLNQPPNNHRRRPKGGPATYDHLDL